MTTTITADTITAREFLRVSLDRSGRQRSNDEQHTDNADAIARQGWTLHPTPYREVGSASRFANRSRDDFAALVDDITAGRFGADVLVLWESSRGSRDVAEWVDLIGACADARVSIFVTTHGRSYDPSRPRDRRSLLEDAVDSDYESGKLSERAHRAVRNNAAAGRPHGTAPFGYRRVYDERSGNLIGQEPDPVEAPIVRDMFAKVAAGWSIKAVARDLAERGIGTRARTVSKDGARIRGNVYRRGDVIPPQPFTAQHLRNMLTRQTYIARRTHHGQVTDAAWEPLVDLATWRQVQTILATPDRRVTRPTSGEPRHLLSMIAACAVCGGPLTSRARGGAQRYVCRDGGHVKVRYADLDALAVDLILSYLSRPDNVERLTADDTDETERARAEIAALQVQLDELADAVVNGEMTARLAGRVEASLEAKRADAQARLSTLTTPAALRGFLAPGADVAARWEAAPLTAQRHVVHLLLGPGGIIGHLQVDRQAQRSVPQPVSERVRIV